MSFETAKKLKKLWWNHSCAFVYDEDGCLFYKNSYNYTDYPWPKNYRKVFEAPTAEELFNKIPFAIYEWEIIWEDKYRLMIDASSRMWLVYIKYINYANKELMRVRDIYVEAFAEAWIWCEKNGYLFS